MVTIYPFRALRPPKERVAQIAAVPYDVVDTEEARALAADNPWSFLHISRAEIDLPPNVDPYSDSVYERAKANFERLIETGPLTTEAEPSIYVYRLRMGSHTQTGIAACFSVDEYDSDIIRKHEKTRRDKEDDRMRHILALRAQTGPVFLTYRPHKRLDELVANVTASEPLYDFTAADDVRHTIWRAPIADPFVEAFREVPALYIADGHHRAASASRARAVLRQQNPRHTGAEEYNRFLAVAFPSDQVQILAYNRVVRDLNNLKPGEFLNEVEKRFEVTTNAPPAPAARGEWSMFLDGRWYGLKLREEFKPATDDAVANLDVSLLQDNLLEPILGIKDVRTDKRIDFVGGARGTAELERLVREGHAAVAFSLYPTTVDDLLRVSDAGGIMPPKSTWFEPKLRDGLLIHLI
ncbi:MAG: DUF1015 domain-containing protein [Pyrinomonas methylaliphatogenes]|nr:DUF1015 domain-containing protein [Pyrinomonas methylaliphatogenes]